MYYCIKIYQKIIIKTLIKIYAFCFAFQEKVVVDGYFK